MLAMEAGGSDIIELGIPFSDPIADGPAIQHSNTVALTQDMTYRACLDLVIDARKRGLSAPVLLMGGCGTCVDGWRAR
jgi:tryptophan synthase